MKLLAQNKKAFHDYDISDRIEVGIVLTGDEVKSIRAGKVVLIGSYATVKNSEFYLINCNIALYGHAYGKEEYDPVKTRKLLIHRRELNRLMGDIAKKGVTVLPLKIYLTKKGIVKIELGIGKHKKAAGKKQALKERDIRKETARELKGKYRF